MTQSRLAHAPSDAEATETADAPDATEAPEATEAADLQCGRCRGFFPGGLTFHPSAVREWWVCPPCREALFGTRSSQSTTS